MINKKTNAIITETVIRDIIDGIKSLKKEDLFGLFGNKSYKSIASATKPLTTVFPVAVESALSIETSTMVAKAQERKAVSMLQMLFSASQITNAADGIEYIKKFHNNLDDSDINVDSVMNMLDNYVSESECISIDTKKKFKMVEEDCKNNLDTLIPMEVSLHGLNECTISNNGRISMIDFNLKKEIEEDAIIDEASKGAYDPNRSKRKREEEDKKKAGDKVYRNMLDKADFLNKQLLPSDVKKANELVPTMMIVNFVSTQGEGKDSIACQMVIGVKAKMYIVTTDDIINRVASKFSGSNTLLNLIKATTRETSFFRDFLFAIDQAKIDALSQSKKGSSSPMWKVLERRAIKSKINRIARRDNDASAITTLVISQETVEYINKEYSINLSDPHQAAKLMDGYNLMSFVIADESSEVCKFMYDTGENSFENLAFSSLERESNDNTKKIVNLMTKIGGR